MKLTPPPSLSHLLFNPMLRFSSKNCAEYKTRIKVYTIHGELQTSIPPYQIILNTKVLVQFNRKICNSSSQNNTTTPFIFNLPPPLNNSKYLIQNLFRLKKKFLLKYLVFNIYLRSKKERKKEIKKEKYKERKKDIKKERYKERKI